MHPAVTHSLLVTRPSRLSRFLLFSVGGHVAVLVVAVLYARAMSGPKVDLNQQPIKASRVRLGTPRAPKLLPRKEQAPPPPKQVDAKPMATPDAPAPAKPAVAVPIPGAKPEPAPAAQKGDKAGEDRRKRLFGAFDKTA